MNLLFIVCCFVWMILCLYAKGKEHIYLSTICKGIASLQFVLLALFNFHTKNYFVLFGLILGFIADIVIDIRFVKKEKKYLFFILGSVIFLFGHISYLIYTLSQSIQPLLYCLIGFILGIIISFSLLKIVHVKKSFQIFGSVYICLVSLLVCSAIGNYVCSTGNGFFTLGTILFLMSDTMLIVNTFEKKNKNLRFIYLLFYYSAQLLIASSLV